MNSPFDNPTMQPPRFEEKEEEDEDSFVFNDTIEGPRVRACQLWQPIVDYFNVKSDQIIESVLVTNHSNSIFFVKKVSFFPEKIELKNNFVRKK